MLDFHNTLIKPTCCRPGLNSRKDVELVKLFEFNHKEGYEYKKGCDEVATGGMTWETVPIIISNMAVTGKIEIATNKAVINSGISVALHKYYSIKDIKDNLSELNNFWISFGLTEDIHQREYKRYLEVPGTKICLDVANGYLDVFVKRIKEFRKLFPDSIIMAGNVCTPGGALQLSKAGADVIKIGIGPGHLCKTRSVTGVGYPQLQAIKDIANYYKYSYKTKVPYLCADGGIYSPGDACKAFVAGADFVMLGSYFIGCDEVGTDGYGMASSEALKRHGEDVAYRAAEGISKQFEHKGKLSDLLKQLLGGIRSCCTYTNSSCIDELGKAELIKIN